ncbi:MAG: hypothetical protein EXR14_05775 [Pelagibacteraceae bacterium]|nr:hypothetical protein [Pelagibacteraceae bacterium]
MFYLILLSIIVFIIILILTSCLGIYFSRKYKFINNISSKRNTIILISILNTIVFLILFEKGYGIAGAIGGAMGYVLGMPFTMGYVGTFIMKRLFKNNPITKKDYWSSSFFSLIWVIIFIIRI